MLFDHQTMSKHRIVQRPSYIDPVTALYEVEERGWLWWKPRGTFDSLESAKERVVELKNQAGRKVKRQVIGVYD